MQVNWIGKVFLRTYLAGKWKLFEWPPCILEATNKLWHQVLAKRLTNKTERKAEVSYEFEKVKPLQKHFQTETKTELGQQSHQIWCSGSTVNIVSSQDALNFSLHKPFLFLIFRRKKKKIVLFYGLVAHYISTTWVKRSGEEIQLSVWSQHSELTKAFYVL